MAVSRQVFALTLSLIASTRIAAAQDRVIDEKHCSILCKLQRNITRNADVSATAPFDAGPVPSERPPAATEGAAPPNPGLIAARRGQVAVDTAADRAALRREKRRLDRELAAPGTGGADLAGQTRGAKP